MFCKLWDICPCIAHVGATALCTEIGVSSVLQGDFLQKHRALLGVRFFYQKISRKIIEALCSITSSVFRKMIVLCRERSGSPVYSGKGSSVLFCMHKEALCFNVTGALCLNEK